jgi:hypothetical protein
VEDGTAGQIPNIESEHGKPIGAWVEPVNDNGLVNAQMAAMLKTEHRMRHGAAIRIARRMPTPTRPSVLANAADQPPTADAAAALDVLYAGRKAALRPVHDALIVAINALCYEVEQVPEKGYISLRRVKQFAMIQPSTLKRIDVGLILRDHEPTHRLEPAKGFNAQFTHRVRIHTFTDIDDELCGWLRHAYHWAGVPSAVTMHQSEESPRGFTAESVTGH